MNGKVLERYAELMIDKIRQMSAGEWQKPWFTPRTGLPQNISGRPYNSMSKHSASCVFFSPLFLPTFVASL